jgi:hypothetical protein
LSRLRFSGLSFWNKLPTTRLPCWRFCYHTTVLLTDGFTTSLLSVDVLESLTGLDFFNEMTEAEERELERVDTFENWEGLFD